MKDSNKNTVQRNKTYVHSTYIDVIRILATYLVIFTHTGDLGSKLYIYGDYDKFHKLIYIIADVVRCINVPLFFMISGALLLPKEESYSHIIKKRITKYVTVLIVMSYFYFTVYYKNAWNDIAMFFQLLCTKGVLGSYWYLYAYLGYLMILPFLRKMVKEMDEKDFKTIMVLGIFFKGLLDIGKDLLGWDGGIEIPFYFASDAVFYPIVGYYLSKVRMEYEKDDKMIREKLLMGGVLSAICIGTTVLMMHWEACQKGEYTETYLKNLSVIPSLFTFVLVRYICGKFDIPDIVRNGIRYVADCTFGVYLFSIFVQVHLSNVYVFINNSLGGRFPLISSFMYVFVVMVAEIVLVMLLRKIPIFRKLL